MTTAPSEVSIADAKRLLVLGEKLLEEAYELPDAIPAVAVGGSDPLSRAIAAEIFEFVEPAIHAVRSEKDRMIKDAHNLIDAAKAVLGNSIGDGAQI
jgi:hypothetical protein